MDLFKEVKEKTFDPIKFKNQRKNIYSKKYQIGETTVRRDRKREALPPGKRKSKTGKIYYEYRANRSDLKNKKI